MPQAVRNFWVDMDVQGRKSTVNTGPRPRNGRISMELSMRQANDVNCISRWSLIMSCWVTADRTPRVEIALRESLGAQFSLLTVQQVPEDRRPIIKTRNAIEGPVYDDLWTQISGPVEITETETLTVVQQPILLPDSATSRYTMKGDGE